MIVCGIDPGLGGAICLLEDGEPPLLAKMPTRQRAIYKGRRVDWATLRGWLWEGRVDFAVLEAQHSMPRQGVASTFTFGGAYEGCVAVLDVRLVPYEEVAPQTWQKAFGIHKIKGAPKNTTKHQAKVIAQSLFPTLDGITLQTADAVLLAEFARRRRGGH